MTAKDRFQSERRVLNDLIRERVGTVSYALFFTVGEGILLPISTSDEEFEETSGNILTEDGRVYSFWFGWDQAAERPALVDWEEVEPEPDWLSDPEYLGARKRLGLSAA